MNYEELLLERLNQLKEIRDRLERMAAIERTAGIACDSPEADPVLNRLRADLYLWVQEAQEAYNAF